MTRGFILRLTVSLYSFTVSFTDADTLRGFLTANYFILRLTVLCYSYTVSITVTLIFPGFLSGPLILFILVCKKGYDRTKKGYDRV